MTLVFLVAMGAVVVGFVLHPIFSREQASPEHLDETGREIERLEDTKNRLLATIKDLDFEYRAGKLSDADYQRVRADDLSHLAQVMARLEELAARRKPAQKDKPIDIPVQCSRCGAELPEKARFCAQCGTEIQSE